MGVYDWITFALSLIYVFLAANNKKWCFPFAFAASLIWAYTSFFIYNLKFDGFLQLFYCVMAIVGWYSWQSDDNTVTQEILKLSKQQHLAIISGGLFASLILVFLLSMYTQTNLPYLDSITTVFSVLATIMLIKRYIDTWIYLLICNLVYIFIYYSQNAFALSMIMVVYSFLAIYGFYSWKKWNLVAT